MTENRSVDSRHGSRRLTSKEPNWTFWSEGNILSHNLGGNYTNVYICQHQTIHLGLVCFIFCKWYVIKVRVRGYSRNYDQNSKVGELGQSGSLKSLISSACSEGQVRYVGWDCDSNWLFARMELSLLTFI